MPATRRRRAALLPLPAADLGQLRERVRALAEKRPAVYQMTGAGGNVLYVGKAKSLRTRLLSYFRASYPDDKAARILYATHDITWTYVPSEFGAFLTECRLIRQHRPHFNWHMNRTRRPVLITVSEGRAPRIRAHVGLGQGDERAYGPFKSMERTQEAVRVLNDLLGLRDCALTMPIVFAGQGDLFGAERRAACPRYDFGLCAGPCAGLVSEDAYREKVEAAVAFLEGRAIQPVDRVVQAMSDAASDANFELAARWRERFEQLEWLLAATSRARSAVDLLTFVYRDPGHLGDDRAYILRHGVVRGSYPWPATPIEDAAFRAAIAEELERPAPPTAPLPAEHLDEILLMMFWFRTHPEALRRTTPLEHWTVPDETSETSLSETMSGVPT
jgi:excinuclease ABC subunit C